MAADDDSYDADREIWRKIYRTLIQENADLDAVLEDKSLYWNDDKEIVDTFAIKTIKRFDPKGPIRNSCPNIRTRRTASLPSSSSVPLSSMPIPTSAI